MRRAAVIGLAGAAAAALLVGVAGAAGPARNLGVLSFTQRTVTVKWQPAQGATGYRLYKDGAAVSTAGAAATQAKFGSLSWAAHVFGVEPLPDGGTSTITVQGKWLETGSSEPSPPPPPSPPPSPPPPSPGAAALWIDTDGGSCTRVVDGPYVDAQACSGIAAAQARAVCGDTVLIKGGTYPSQTVNVAEKDCGAYVTYTPAPGEVFTTRTIRVESGDWMRFLGGWPAINNFQMLDSGAQGSTSGFHLAPVGMGTQELVDHIWVEGAYFEMILMRGADDVTFKGNDIGPGKSDLWDEKIWVSAAHDGSEYVNNLSSNWVMDSNFVHNFSWENCRAQGCHVECMTFEAHNFVFRGNEFLDCDVFGLILANDQGYATTGTQNLIEGNVIHCCKTSSGYSLAFGDTEAGSVVTVRGNELRGGVTTALGGSVGTIVACGNTGTGIRPSAAWSAPC